ncbi:unnamed protein product, partial [Musa acuminata subsp. burmannicoides]
MRFEVLADWIILYCLPIKTYTPEFFTFNENKKKKGWNKNGLSVEPSFLLCWLELESPLTFLADINPTWGRIEPIARSSTESRGVVVMRGEVSSGTNDKLIDEFDLVNNQRREK